MKKSRIQTLLIGFATALLLGRMFSLSMPLLYSPEVQSAKGLVVGRTYQNSSLGIELTADPDLTFGSPKIKGEHREIPVSITIEAWGLLRAGVAPEGLAFSAIALDYYPPGRRSTDDCVKRVIEANQRDGYKTVDDSLTGELGGVSFARTNFMKAGQAYQSVFVRACAARVLIFVFTGPDRDTVNRLISRTELKLDLATSGCARQR